MVGIPTIAIILGLQFWTSAVIVIIEAITIKNLLGAKRGRSFGTSFLANLLSFCVAVPLSRGFLAFIVTRLFKHSSGGIIDILQGAVRTSGSTGTTQLPYVLSIILSFVVAFFFSVIIEYYMLRLMFKGKDKKHIQKTARIMNGLTYGLTILVLLGAYKTGML